MRKTKLYAEAFFKNLTEDQKVPAYSQLKALEDLMVQLKDYVSFMIHNPAEFSQVRSVVEGDYEPLTLNFLEVIIQDGMVNRLAAIIDDYKQILVNKGLLANIQVTTARPLSEEARQVLEAEIESYWKGPKDYNYQVNPYYIEGIHLKINDAVIDTTYRSRLNQIIKEV